MSNPFLTPGTPAVRLERQRRERFRLGVYCTLAALGVFVGAMLFQGCQKEQANSPSSQLALGTNSSPVDAPVPVPNQIAQSPAVSLPASVPEPTATNSLVNSSTLSVPEPAAHTAVAATYTVKRGDTLTKIARTHRTSVTAIKSANSLKTDRIVAGTRITLPAPESPAAPK